MPPAAAAAKAGLQGFHASKGGGLAVGAAAATAKGASAAAAGGVTVKPEDSKEAAKAARFSSVGIST